MLARVYYQLPLGSDAFPGTVLSDEAGWRWGLGEEEELFLPHVQAVSHGVGASGSLRWPCTLSLG